MILIIDNYLKNGRVNQIKCAVQKYTNEPIKIINFKQVKQIDFCEVSCLILSGSTCNLSNKKDEKKYSDEIESVKRCPVPILGICFGHHILGKAYDSEILRGKRIKKLEKVKIVTSDDLLGSWDIYHEITVEESHSDYVKELPREFTLLASSESCEIEAMKHDTKPTYSTQFHPERTPDGHRVIGNFIRNVVNAHPHSSL